MNERTYLHSSVLVVALRISKTALLDRRLSTVMGEWITGVRQAKQGKEKEGREGEGGKGWDGIGWDGMGKEKERLGEAR